MEERLRLVTRSGFGSFLGWSGPRGCLVTLVLFLGAENTHSCLESRLTLFSPRAAGRWAGIPSDPTMPLWELGAHQPRPQAHRHRNRLRVSGQDAGLWEGSVLPKVILLWQILKPTART